MNSVLPVLPKAVHPQPRVTFGNDTPNPAEKAEKSTTPKQDKDPNWLESTFNGIINFFTQCKNIANGLWASASILMHYGKWNEKLSLKTESDSNTPYARTLAIADLSYASFRDNLNQLMGLIQFKNETDAQGSPKTQADKTTFHLFSSVIDRYPHLLSQSQDLPGGLDPLEKALEHASAVYTSEKANQALRNYRNDKAQNTFNNHAPSQCQEYLRTLWQSLA
jgi:hypothetical protein